MARDQRIPSLRYSPRDPRGVPELVEEGDAPPNAPPAASSSGQSSHATRMVTLSIEPLSIALRMSARAAASALPWPSTSPPGGGGCTTPRPRAAVHAIWTACESSTTSHSPSLAMMRSRSCGESSCERTSGSCDTRGTLVHLLSSRLPDERGNQTSSERGGRQSDVITVALLSSRSPKARLMASMVDVQSRASSEVIRGHHRRRG